MVWTLNIGHIETTAASTTTGLTTANPLSDCAHKIEAKFEDGSTNDYTTTYTMIDGTTNQLGWEKFL